MTDETVHIQPAIPSRAAQQPVPMFTDDPVRMEERIKPIRKAKKKKPVYLASRLSATEVRKINAKRKKNMKKAKKVVKRRASIQGKGGDRGEQTRRTTSPKNPNRPLEMKNQLSAVLSMVGTLQKSELVFFSQAVPAMQALSRSGRRRVIAALQQVYE